LCIALPAKQHEIKSPTTKKLFHSFPKYQQVVGPDLILVSIWPAVSEVIVHPKLACCWVEKEELGGSRSDWSSHAVHDLIPLQVETHSFHTLRQARKQDLIIT